ncbi:MAG: hypothetical protein M3P51_11310 [Chloroflexota bacterium]|nr:hypothetical protein [Chloroflexota bacterium]
MNLEKVEYVALSGYPMLRLVINGREALVDSRMSPAIRKAGYVKLLGEWEELLPTTILPGDPEPGGNSQPTPMHGLTNEPEILTAFDYFRKAVQDGTFTGRPYIPS